MYKIPIVVGVTGHRKLRLEDYPILEEKVSQELLKIKKLAPDSPLVLLDSLALGGDAICARAALKLGYSLEVPLPFEIDEYRKDFDKDNLSIFNNQINEASKVYEIHKLNDLENRDDGYADAGLYIATHSHIIIALWDGVKGKAKGCGTAEFVDFVREGFDPSIIVPTPYISIIHISAIREGKDGESGIVKYYEKHDGDYKKLLINTNNFNKDTEDKKLNEYSLIENNDNQIINDFHDLYKKSDALSSYYQKKYLKTIKYSSILGVGIVLSLLFYNQIGIKWLLIFYAIFPLISKLVVDKALKGNYLERYIEARCLAESSRVQLFLLLSGINKSVAYGYPWSIREDNDWIIKAMMTRLRYTDKQYLNDSVKSKKLIKDQLDYHQKALKNEKESSLKAKNASKTINNITYINYIIVLVSEFVTTDIFRKTLFSISTFDINIHTLLKITLGIISAIAALLNNYYGKLSLNRKIEEHIRYIDLYEEALRKMDNYDQELLWVIAKEELTENSSWRTYMKNNNPAVIIK